MKKPITKVTIVDEKNDGVTRSLVAQITADGDLVLEGQDVGQYVKETFGDSDYEYWLTIPSMFKETVLLHLVKERFHSATEMQAWLKKKKIPCEFSNFI